MAPAALHHHVCADRPSRMFFRDTENHHVPHIHGIEIHQEDLLADWNLAVNGKTPFPIKGLDQ
jgi:hypothetical protein